MKFTDLLNSGSLNDLNDLNEPPPIYDLTLSQYHSSGSTYEETYTTEVQTNEATPDEEAREDKQKKKGQSQRSSNFNVEEDKLLVSAWLNVSLDPIQGSSQKKGTFWKRITQYFEENRKWEGGRSERSLTSRWQTISSNVSRFCGHYNAVENLRRSGYTELDKIEEARQNYQKHEGSSFTLDHCWIIMRFQQKWMVEHQKIESKRKPKESSNKNTNSIDLEDDDAEGPQPASLKRPIGRKAAKDAMKKAKYAHKDGDNDNEATKTRTELEELRARRLESDRIKAEQFKLLLANEQEQVALRKKEIELQTRSEDAKIMSMDTSKMPPFQAEYFISLQREILAKRASMSGSE